MPFSSRPISFVDALASSDFKAAASVLSIEALGAVLDVGASLACVAGEGSSGI